MKSITSSENPLFKQLIKLSESAVQRRESGLTLLDGMHLITAYRASLGSPQRLVIGESAIQNEEVKGLLVQLEREQSVPVVVMSDSLFRAVSQVKTPIGIIALISIPLMDTIPVYQGESFSVLLETIQDPGNLGSILRSAAAAGAVDIYLSTGCADAWSPKTLRASMGAHFKLRIHEQSDLIKVAREFSGKVIATTLHAKSHLYQAQLTGPVAFLFGNEGAGLSNEVLQSSNDQMSIHMPGGTESLNVAAAAAVCFFERVRQSAEVIK
ncbi:MAG: RNA methyltransferase [Nitrosospira sp.]|nr:RNA methyltransferase [Nitrosospira sp.]MDW7665827.1 RNA methyltransferase [Nitrosomonadaceae bacterium]MBI0409318.1 RNA methyltransferase [Nitrosospira sp.]MBI0410292.1 RNA methyltransferase [Nitrosospira sp.]MBI0411799.1 RNA methyltransferase [Nitrosospira sp.]